MGRVTVHLRRDVEWAEFRTGRARGTAFLDGSLLDADALARLIDESPNPLATIAGALSGEFALIRLTDDGVEAAVDHVRSRPLFYAVADHRALLSDSPQWLADTLDRPTFSPVAELEFLLAGIVTGRDTLYEEIETLQAGEVIELDVRGRSISTVRQNHFEYIPQGTQRPKAVLLGELDAVMERAVDRLTDVADGRQIAVPLSGGYDSRLVACLLVREGYPAVTTFSFGRRGNPESGISERVAAELGLPWSFIEYTNDRWRRWYDSTDRREYFAAAFDFCTSPSIGTCPALDELAHRGTLDDDAIIASGDSITTTGEHVPPRFGLETPGRIGERDGITRTDIVEEIFDMQYTLWEPAPDDVGLIYGRIADRLGAVELSDGVSAASAIEAWDWRERQSKFIVSPAEYTYGGYDSWLPLFDREYVEFWKEVPLEHRIGKTLHKEYVDTLFAEQSRSGNVVTADRSQYGMTGKLKQLVASSPLSRVAEPLYRGVSRKTPYSRDFLAGYGIVPESLFRRLYTGTESVHSFEVLDLTGRVSLAPPIPRNPPDDGVVALHPEDAQALADIRHDLPWFGTI